MIKLRDLVSKKNSRGDIMASCTCENWTLEDLASALQNMNKDNKIIAVPMFQRGQRWNMNQRKVFIDSLIKGYPVGTMLFYETRCNNIIYKRFIQTFLLPRMYNVCAVEF